MRVNHIALATILSAVPITGCRQDGDELEWQKVGHAWEFVGTPGQPRAIIRIEKEAPHTILISEGQFLDSSLGEAKSGDAEIVLRKITDPDEQKTVQVPTGRVAVIDDSGAVTQLDPGAVAWDDGVLELDPSGVQFRDLLESVAKASRKQKEDAEQDGGGQPATRPESK
jgi:hypothetical protein